MGIIAFIANITKIITVAETLIKFLKRYKLFAFVTIISIIMITFSCYKIAERYYQNIPYRNAVKYDDYVKYVNDTLIKCGDKTAISISVINTDPTDKVKGLRLGRFEIARACDKRDKTNNCIINLKDRKPSLYSVDHKVDSSSYDFFLSIGRSLLPAHFNFRDSEDKQNFSSISFYPAINFIITKSDWFEEEIIEDLWITSILSNDSTVLYVITFLSAKPRSKSNCFDNDSILIGLKDFIINRNSY